MVLRVVLTAVTGMMATAVASIGWSLAVPARSVPAPAPTVTPAEQLQRSLLRKNIGRAGDPVLSAMFVEIANRHFPGRLSPLPVLWEPGLGRVGALEGPAFVLQGMFGAAGAQWVILLNPEIQGDPAAIARALCHEMVHAYLHAHGGESTAHGPAFQAVLRQLSAEGAFEGIEADPADRARLRTWLDAESARLDDERTALDQVGQEIAAGVVDSDRVVAANDRADRFNRDLEHFRAEAARYHLMLVYPDGIDEERTYPALATGLRSP